MLLDGRYELQEQLSHGSNGMAFIYRGWDTYEKRNMAIKMLRNVYSHEPELVIRFQRGAKALLGLRHSNIIEIYDAGQSEGEYYISMELIEGTDLRRYLRSRGALAVDRTVTLAHDIGLGLGVAHRRGIVHRSVSPQHILVDRDGSIKLHAFSIGPGNIVQYLAPEQVQDKQLTPATDVYALGIIMYEMLAGRTPFDGETPVDVAMQHIHNAPIPLGQLNPSIPPRLEEII